MCHINRFINISHYQLSIFAVFIWTYRSELFHNFCFKQIKKMFLLIQLDWRFPLDGLSTKPIRLKTELRSFHISLCVFSASRNGASDIIYLIIKIHMVYWWVSMLLVHNEKSYIRKSHQITHRQEKEIFLALYQKCWFLLGFLWEDAREGGEGESFEKEREKEGHIFLFHQHWLYCLHWLRRSWNKLLLDIAKSFLPCKCWTK